MTQAITITVRDGRAYLSTPYSRDFVSGVKLMGGRWDGSYWHVNEGLVEEARELIRRTYGYDDQTAPETADVRIRFNEMVCADRRGIEIYGRTVALAFGRDSGAKIGDNVAFLEGGAGSGGSRNNWMTIIRAGSVILMKEVPVSLLSSELPDGAVIVSDTDAKADALRTRKAQLEAELAEINAQLDARV